MIKAQALCLVLLILVCCKRGHIQDKSPTMDPVQNANTTQLKTEELQSKTSVTLQIAKGRDRTLEITLENNGDQPIYVFYDPPKNRNASSFIVYDIQRLVGKDEFKRYSASFHFIPAMHPLEPQTALHYVIDIEGLKKGQYRVHIGYWDDEKIYQLYQEKDDNMSEDELRLMDKSAKSVYSQIFTVPDNIR